MPNWVYVPAVLETVGVYEPLDAESVRTSKTVHALHVELSVDVRLAIW